MKYKHLMIPNTVLSDELSVNLQNYNYQIYSVRHTCQNKVKTLSNVLVPYIKIAIICKGYCDISIQGCHYEGGPGDLFIIPPYRTHSAQFISDSLETYELLFQVGGQFKQEQWLLLLKHNCYFKELINDFQFRFLKSVFLDANECSQGYVLQIKHLIDFLMIEMIKRVPCCYDNQPLDGSLMNTVEMFLHELDVSQNLFTVKEYCNALNISQSYLCRCTLAVVGLSPQTLIIQHRMYRSLTLLADSSLSIKDISIRLNYLNPNYFSQQFRKTFNLTPKQYRAIYFNITS